MKTFIEKKEKTAISIGMRIYAFMFLIICSLPAMAGDQDFKAMKEEAAFQNIVSYILMAVTFLVVIAIAWFGSVKKKKRGTTSEQHAPPVHPHHHIHHSAHDKRYGTHHR